MDRAQLERACAWLDEMTPAMLDELVELCDRNSYSENLDGLLDVSRLLIELFREIDAKPRQIDLPPRESTDDQGQLISSISAPALRWDSIGHRDQAHPRRPRALLTIHFDTVYPVHHHPSKCQKIDEDRLLGPGVIDAKGGIIVLKWALLAGLRFDLLGHLDWTVILTPDEEIGSPSSMRLWQEIADQFDFGLLFEPSLPSGALVDRRKGTGNFHWMVQGKSAHSGRNFNDGRNAVVWASSLAMELHRLNGQMPGVTVNVGRMIGGDALNVVPDRCSLRANVRVETMEQLAWIEKEIDRITSEHHRLDEGFACRVTGGLGSPPKECDSKTKSLKVVLEMAASKIGQTIEWSMSGGASDGNKLAALGLANLDSLGPEGGELHSPQEWIRISSLARKASLALAMLVEWKHRPL